VNRVRRDSDTGLARGRTLGRTERRKDDERQNDQFHRAGHERYSSDKEQQATREPIPALHNRLISVARMNRGGVRTTHPGSKRAHGTKVARTPAQLTPGDSSELPS